MEHNYLKLYCHNLNHFLFWTLTLKAETPDFRCTPLPFPSRPPHSSPLPLVCFDAAAVGF